MSTTAREDEAFIEAIISTRLLEEAIEWIADRLEPDQVFSIEQLEQWAEGNGFIKAGEEE